MAAKLYSPMAGSGITAALSLLAFILFASSLIEQIPLAALVGVMFMVVIGTFAWRSFRILRHIPRHDAFVLVLVTAVTVISDLAVAVVIGVIVSALVFAWYTTFVGMIVACCPARSVAWCCLNLL